MTIMDNVEGTQECDGWRPSFGPAPAGVLPSIVAPRPWSAMHMSRDQGLAALQKLRDRHTFWDSKLFKACESGQLSREDFKFIFSQYYLYSRNFTRYLSAAMANCEDDLYRSRLTANLWEEGGEKDIEKRHAQIFRKFLREGLSIDIDHIDYLDGTRNFVGEFLRFCLQSHPMASSAFLSLGTEGIVSRMYSSFVEGLAKAGVEEKHLEFFRIHIGCDDDHAATLEKMMCSYYGEPDWFNSCERAMDYALLLRQRFFDTLMEELPFERVRGVIANVRDPASPLAGGPYLHSGASRGTNLYSNTDVNKGIDFTVERLPFKAQVLDPRIVRIPVGNCNELHRHAHETLFHIMSGNAQVEIGDTRVQVKAGDTVFVPRWTMHRTSNIGTEELTYFAVTDFGLASKLAEGNYLEGHREKPEQDHSFAE
jgi:mannose-6-phosphate isomerase-like protein (cupin superfamily)/pyrroloquinoline quinone (PQQ) biosynthesis protein C